MDFSGKCWPRQYNTCGPRLVTLLLFLAATLNEVAGKRHLCFVYPNRDTFASIFAGYLTLAGLFRIPHFFVFKLRCFEWPPHQLRFYLTCILTFYLAFCLWFYRDKYCDSQFDSLSLSGILSDKQYCIWFGKYSGRVGEEALRLRKEAQKSRGPPPRGEEIIDFNDSHIVLDGQSGGGLIRDNLDKKKKVGLALLSSYSSSGRDSSGVI